GAVGAQGVNSSSVTGGFTAGYNWQVSHAVLGLEGDINYFGFKGSATGSALYPCCAPTGFTVSSQVSADWLATIRGRIGFLATLTAFATGFPSNVYTHSVELKSNIVRVGVNYKFGGPVVARY